MKNISELLGEYYGSSEDFERWKAQIDLRNTYELDENMSKILVGSKLKGKALKWYHSRADHLAMSVEELLQEMRSMFDQPLRQLESRKKIEAREWRRNEAFNNHCHEKLILGNRVPVTKEELVDYLIGGISPESLRNQAKMHSFSSVQDLVKVFSKVTLEPERGYRRDASNFKDAKRKTGGSPIKTGVRKLTDDASKVGNRGIWRCYECSETDHLAKECPSRTKRNGKTATPKKSSDKKQIKLVQDETKSEGSLAEDDREDEDRSEEEEIGFVDFKNELKDKFQRMVQVKVQANQQFSGIARIDTGCSVSLIQGDTVNSAFIKKDVNGINITVLIDRN